MKMTLIWTQLVLVAAWVVLMSRKKPSYAWDLVTVGVSYALLADWGIMLLLAL